jgi:hypothetical protein
MVPPDTAVAIASPVGEAILASVTTMFVEAAVEVGEIVKIAFATIPVVMTLLFRP